MCLTTVGGGPLAATDRELGRRYGAPTVERNGSTAERMSFQNGLNSFMGPADVLPTRANAPGPAAWRLTSTISKIHLDRLTFVSEMTKKYGDVVRFRMGSKSVFLIGNGRAAKHILATNQDNYRKGMGLTDASPLLGSGLLTSDGMTWRRQHSAMQPFFTTDAINRYVSVMVDEIKLMMCRWRKPAANGAVIDVAAEMSQLTLRILSRTLFGIALDDCARIAGPALNIVMRHAMMRMVFPFLAHMPTAANFRYVNALRQLNSAVTDLINAKRAKSHDADQSCDLLFQLLHPHDGPVQDARVRDEVMTILVAGHETTAAALSWAFHLLSRHPEVDERLASESASLPDEPSRISQLRVLAYTSNVLDETLRLYPSVWILPREAIADDEIEGYRVSSGSAVLVCPYVLHRNPLIWDNSESFDPDRFSGSGTESPPPYCYIPFGAGRRSCIGRHFGALEARLVLALVCRRFRFVPEGKRNVVAEPLLTLRPKGSLPMRIFPRRHLSCS